MLGNSDKVKAGCRVLTGGENDAAAATTTAPAPPSLPLPLKRSLNQYDHGHGHGHGHDLHQVTGLGLQDEGVDGGQGQDYQHRLQPQTSKKQRLMTTETTVMMHHYHHHHEEGEGEGGEELPVAMSIMSTLTSSSAPVDALNATEETLTTTTVTPVVEKEKDEGEISQIPSSSLSPLDTVRNVLHAQLLENTSPSSAEEREGDVLTAPRMQSNSVLLIGPRGSGKTKVLNEILTQLTEKFYPKQQQEHQDTDSTLPPPPPIVITLNGMVLTNEKLALREIALQLAFDGDHLEETLKSMSFADCFSYIISKLYSTTSTSSSKRPLPRPVVIFILEEFDLFALHPKQALLYNLFDVVQSSPNAIAVVASTCRVDSLDLLEKRVKSRFSQRVICFTTPSCTDSFVDIVRAGLKLPAHLTTATNRGSSSLIQLPPLTAKYVKQFNARVDQITKNSKFLDRVGDIVALNRNLNEVLTVCRMAVSRLSTPVDEGDPLPLLTLDMFLDAFDMMRQDQKMEVMMDISLLELSLLIAMKKLTEREFETYNFEMVYEEYLKFMRSALQQGRLRELKFVKSVVLKAFESLLHIELVRHVEGFGHCPPEFRMVRSTVHNYRLLETVQRREDVGDLMTLWSGEKLLEGFTKK